MEGYFVFHLICLLFCEMVISSRHFHWGPTKYHKLSKTKYHKKAPRCHNIDNKTTENYHNAQQSRTKSTNIYKNFKHVCSFPRLKRLHFITMQWLKQLSLHKPQFAGRKLVFSILETTIFTVLWVWCSNMMCGVIDILRSLHLLTLEDRQKRCMGCISQVLYNPQA